MTKSCSTSSANRWRQRSAAYGVADLGAAALAGLLLVCSHPAAAVDEISRIALPRVLSKPRAGIYLVANERLYDPLFGKSVILLAEHNGRGSVGLMINRNTAIPVEDALPELVLPGQQDATVHIGGPVRSDSMRLLVRLAEPGFIGRPGMLPILNNVYLVNDIDVLRAILGEGTSGNGRPQLRFYAGYTGWAAGQLQAEIERGDWYMIEADPRHIFFTPPDELWRLLLETANATWALRRDSTRVPRTDVISITEPSAPKPGLRWTPYNAAMERGTQTPASSAV